MKIVTITETKHPIILTEEGIEEHRLPNTCDECIYHRVFRGEMQCTELMNEVNDHPYYTKLENCPLVELPDDLEYLIKMSYNSMKIKRREQESEEV